MYYRKTKSGVLVPSKNEREYTRTPKNSGCCGLHWLPANGICEEHQPDDGPGILMKNCSNCWYYNDRKLKYNKI